MKYSILLPVLLAGCTDNNASVDIDRYLAVTPTNMCVADPANLIDRDSGLLDVGMATIGATAGVGGFIAAPVVRNNMPLRAAMGQIDLDAITVTGFDVELSVPGTLASAISQPNFFVEVASGRIDAGGTAVHAFFDELIPSAMARQLAGVVPVGTTNLPVIIAHTRPVAERVDGSTFNGGWSDFPITICNFCLTGGPPQACPSGGFTSSQVLPGGCFMQQDDSETCCIDTTNRLVCGKQVPQH
jgi:hypothetical protein